jgi:hypothetical protein
MNKHPIKSKTINSAIIIIIIALMSLLGFGESEIVTTFDGLGQQNQTETIKEVGTLLGAAGVLYGRFKVKEDDK